ncbi:MAG TPA: MBL fold metallo-hydrolase, partial [Solirubrobacteraceae bacterium]
FFPPEWGSVEPWEADQPLDGGERLQLAGLDIEVVSTPGHSPGHVTYAIDGALFSGDVLFQNSIGRTDLPGADHATLMASIAALLERFDDDTTVHPGHMGLTTLGRERATNPFLQALAGR